MNWQAIMDGVRALVVSASGLPADRVRWTNEPRAGVWRTLPVIDLVLRTEASLGEDSFIRTDTETGDAPIEITQVGPRQIRIDIRVETDSQLPGQTATNLASLIRSRMKRPALLEALRSSAELALATTEPTVDADFTSDDRACSLSVFSALFNAAENDVDTSDTGDYFDRLGVASDKLVHAEGVDGPQVDLEIPETP